MSYFFEIWVRGFAKDYARDISSIKDDTYHPHITLVRPFEKIHVPENIIKDKAAEFCYEKDPIPFTLDGQGNFESKYFFIPVTNCDKLLEFDTGLEKLLEDDVEFYEKLDNKKNLHLTLNTKEPILCDEKIDQYMLRLTAIRDKLIWFSYDFVTKEVLNRDESLDKTKWYNTVHQFTEKYGLLPTREGFKQIK